jgi:hypothetical protein
MPRSPRLADNLEFQPLGDGYLVTEQGTDWAHFLNRTAMLIILQCDGVTTPEQIALNLQELHGLDAPPIGDVEEVLAQLEAQGVVRQDDDKDRAVSGTDNATMVREKAHA